MNYCSIEDAWKNSDSLTDQFKLKKKTIENFSIPIKIDNEEYYSKNQEQNHEYSHEYNHDYNYEYNHNNKNQKEKEKQHENENNFNYNLDFNIDNKFINDINENKINNQDQNKINNQDQYKDKNKINNQDQKINNTKINNTNNYENIFICDDFLDHLETCKVCRMKMRNRFKSNIIEKIDNIIIDNKDIILLLLLILFALIFCNLIITIFK